MCKQMNGKPSSCELREHAAECVPAKRPCTAESLVQLVEDNASSTGSGETIEGSSIEVVNQLPDFRIQLQAELIGR